MSPFTGPRRDTFQADLDELRQATPVGWPPWTIEEQERPHPELEPINCRCRTRPPSECRDPDCTDADCDGERHE